MSFEGLKNLKEIRVFLITLIVITIVSAGALFVVLYMKANAVLESTMKEEAAAYFSLLVKARAWNALHGGVYVEKKDGVESNAFLEKVGIKPDIKCEDGRVFTLRNPSSMTREISELMKTEGMWFHMTSLKPVNPQNKPDSFEKKALEAIEGGSQEVVGIERNGPNPMFRFMGPLYYEQSCSRCHEKQGYREGSLRGGISINIPIARLDSVVRENRLIVGSLTIVAVGLLLSIVSIMVSRLATRLDRTQRVLKEATITDELTGVRNRRYIMERLKEEFERAKRQHTPLGLIVLDIDHFKSINDTFGHLFGDTVLRMVAVQMRMTLRKYEVLARTGGEEFLIISPDSNIEGIVHIAERVLNVVRDNKIVDRGRQISVTVSAGATMLRETDTVDTFLSRADDALYQAKNRGRDRVEVL